jgi:exopolysaccharide biosynthesis polyprenyl glycosylphosphotransferase
MLLAGDTLFTFAGVASAWWLRYESRLGQIGIDVPDAKFARYLPLQLLGVALLIAAFAQFGLYDSRLLLRRYQSLNAILKGSAFWLAAYLGISLVLKFDPPISRLFVVLAFFCVVALLYGWRTVAYAAVTHTALVDRLRRRALLLGWNEQARELADEIGRDPAHPYVLAGFVPLGETRPPFVAPSAGAEPESRFQPKLREIGTLDGLDETLRQEGIDVVILTRLDLPRAEMRRIVETCERTYVEWKAVPSAFDIFLSGLRLQTIGRVPVLGVEELAINRLFNRGSKRLFDLVASVLGLAIAAPVIAVLALLIKHESSSGPIFFRQTRVGTGHRPFVLWKLRSMAPGAEAADAARQSTARDDSRILRIGAFMRRWNLDELPQFWNVLRGEMSLVGPRPERPQHVDHLAESIPHYLPRHIVKPGMTGWAQIHGLRGDTDLAARVQHDIYYIENWSIWLDVQIVLLTFVRWRNPNAY